MARTACSQCARRSRRSGSRPPPGGAPGAAAVWLALAAGMRPVRREVNEVSSLTLSIASGVNPEGLREALARVRGVREVEVLAQERIARIQVVPGQWDERSVRKLVTGEI